MAAQYRFAAAALVFAAILLADVPEVRAEVEEPTLAQAADADKAAKAKLVCTRERVVGTNVKKKTCRTQEEVDLLREASQQSLRDLQNKGGERPGG